MLSIRITKERLYAELRSKNIRHLGQVKRLYMEASGDFSILENEKKLTGWQLCLVGTMNCVPAGKQQIHWFVRTEAPNGMSQQVTAIIAREQLAKQLFCCRRKRSKNEWENASFER